MATPGRVPPKPAAKPATPKPGGLSNALTSAPILKAGTPLVPDTQKFPAPTGGLRPGTPSLIAPRPAFGPALGGFGAGGNAGGGGLSAALGGVGGTPAYQAWLAKLLASRRPAPGGFGMAASAPMLRAGTPLVPDHFALKTPGGIF